MLQKCEDLLSTAIFPGPPIGWAARLPVDLDRAGLGRAAGLTLLLPVKHNSSHDSSRGPSLLEAPA